MSGPTLLRLAGTIARNTLTEPWACRKCRGGKNGSYDTCYDCGNVYPAGSFPDALGFVTYAADNTAMGTVFYNYKSARSTDKQQAIIAQLVRHGLNHVACGSRGPCGNFIPVTHWSVVPSTRNRGAHKLRDIVDSIMPQGRPFLEMLHTGVEATRSSVQNDLFSAENIEGKDAHVLLFEDAWVTGNRALSAVSTLRNAGAKRVTLLCLCRWLRFDFIDDSANENRSELHNQLIKQKHFDPNYCIFRPGTHCASLKTAAPSP